LSQFLAPGRLLIRSRGNIPVNNLPENPREDIREESLSERMDPAVEEFGEHIVVRVELLRIVISELVGWTPLAGSSQNLSHASTAPKCPLARVLSRSESLSATTTISRLSTLGTFVLIK